MVISGRMNTSVVTPFVPAVTLRATSRKCAVRRSAAAATGSVETEKLYTELAAVLEDYKRAPPVFKQELSSEVFGLCEKLSAAGALPKWGAASTDLPPRRQVNLGELRVAGVKVPQAISEVSVRNDAAFLFSVVATTSISAVVLGATLPGDWGFFSSYLVGSISFVVLGIGSVNPGILQFAIDSFSQLWPDYKERVCRHEAAHFLTAHLLGVPVANYSLLLGKEHTDLAEAALQRRLIAKQLNDDEVNRLSVIAMAGATAEAMNYEDVLGQNADMFDLQRIMNRSVSKLGNSQQQNQTRWAVLQAASLMRQYKKEYDALREAMASGASVADCIKAIENC